MKIKIKSQNLLKNNTTNDNFKKRRKKKEIDIVYFSKKINKNIKLSNFMNLLLPLLKAKKKLN